MPLTLNIGFVFVNYNNSIITHELIKSLRAQNAEHNFPIVIVDNASSDKDVKILHEIRATEKNVIVLFSNENIGYFKGLNKGIAYLREKYQSNCMIIGNNDLLFPDGFIQSLYTNNKIFDSYPVISPNIVSSTGVHQNPHVINNISFFREVIYDIYYSNHLVSKLILFLAKITKKVSDRADELEHEKSGLIYQGHGSCYILGPLFFEHFESLYAPTFLFGEELFLTIQLREKGFKVYYEPEIVVIHEGHSSIDKFPSKVMWKFGKIAHKEYRKHIRLRNGYKI
jgi:GT2 family glycosyltransferase